MLDSHKVMLTQRWSVFVLWTREEKEILPLRLEAEVS
jgi:hypothetical protein